MKASLSSGSGSVEAIPGKYCQKIACLICKNILKNAVVCLSICTCKFSPVTPRLIPLFSLIWNSFIHINYTTEGASPVHCHSQCVPVASLLFTYLFPDLEYKICPNLVACLIKQSEHAFCCYDNCCKYTPALGVSVN
jgi:hypothetical protein